ncbi:hypothetical protein FGB62_25g054 [Gracilaria domingensis]|nr:hypothetical protein FGB62_25g054 [Gracilaria domingensis]
MTRTTSVASLHEQVGHNAMEREAIVITVQAVLHEVAAGVWGVGAPETHVEGAVGGVKRNAPVSGGAGRGVECGRGGGGGKGEEERMRGARASCSETWRGWGGGGGSLKSGSTGALALRMVQPSAVGTAQADPARIDWCVHCALR